MKPLDPRRARFVEEYAVDLNAAAAAERAGYPAAWARRYGSRLLARRDIAAAVAAREKRALAAAELSADRILREAARIAFADIRQLFRPDGTPRAIAEIDAETAAAVASIDTRRGDRARKLRLRNKPAALVLLGRHLGLWSEPEPDADDGCGGESLAQAIARGRQKVIDAVVREAAARATSGQAPETPRE